MADVGDEGGNVGKSPPRGGTSCSIVSHGTARQRARARATIARIGETAHRRPSDAPRKHSVGERLQGRIAENNNFTSDVPVPIGVASAEAEVLTGRASMFVVVEAFSSGAGLGGARGKRYFVISQPEYGGRRQGGSSRRD